MNAIHKLITSSRNLRSVRSLSNAPSPGKAHIPPPPPPGKPPVTSREIIQKRVFPVLGVIVASYILMNPATPVAPPVDGAQTQLPATSSLSST